MKMNTLDFTAICYLNNIPLAPLQTLASVANVQKFVPYTVSRSNRFLLLKTSLSWAGDQTNLNELKKLISDKLPIDNKFSNYLIPVAVVLDNNCIISIPAFWNLLNGLCEKQEQDVLFKAIVAPGDQLIDTIDDTLQDCQSLTILHHFDTLYSLDQILSNLIPQR